MARSMLLNACLLAAAVTAQSTSSPTITIPLVSPAPASCVPFSTVIVATVLAPPPIYQNAGYSVTPSSLPQQGASSNGQSGAAVQMIGQIGNAQPGTTVVVNNGQSGYAQPGTVIIINGAQNNGQPGNFLLGNGQTVNINGGTTIIINNGGTQIPAIAVNAGVKCADGQPPRPPYILTGKGDAYLTCPNTDYLPRIAKRQINSIVAAGGDPNQGCALYCDSIGGCLAVSYTQNTDGSYRCTARSDLSNPQTIFGVTALVEVATNIPANSNSTTTTASSRTDSTTSGLASSTTGTVSTTGSAASTTSPNASTSGLSTTGSTTGASTGTTSVGTTLSTSTVSTSTGRSTITTGTTAVTTVTTVTTGTTSITTPRITTAPTSTTAVTTTTTTAPSTTTTAAAFMADPCVPGTDTCVNNADFNNVCGQQGNPTSGNMLYSVGSVQQQTYKQCVTQCSLNQACNYLDYTISTGNCIFYGTDPNSGMDHLDVNGFTDNPDKDFAYFVKSC